MDAVIEAALGWIEGIGSCCARVFVFGAGAGGCATTS